jgi:hypothetical protein
MPSNLLNPPTTTLAAPSPPIAHFVSEALIQDRKILSPVVLGP